MTLRGLILGLLAAVIAFAACSDDRPDSPAPDPEPAAQQTQQPTQAEQPAQPALLTPRWPRDNWRPLAQVVQANAELPLLNQAQPRLVRGVGAPLQARRRALGSRRGRRPLERVGGAYPP